jgi:hypothetical protein
MNNIIKMPLSKTPVETSRDIVAQNLAPEKVKVLYIAGFERSGSTLVNRVLGQLDDFVAWGELRDIWDHAILQNRTCSCGVPFHNCEAWDKILVAAFGSRSNIDAQAFFQLQRQTRARMFLTTLGPLGKKQLQKQSQAYFAALAPLYSAIHSTTACRVIVDSTKASWYGAALGLLPNIDLYVVHVTRDPRGVCHSLKRRKSEGEPEAQWYNPVHAALSWNLKNSAVEALLNTSSDRYLRLQFEEFVANPKDSLAKILHLLGETATTLPFTSDSVVEMGVDHIFAGSPSSRSQTGKVDLRLDERWKTELPPVERRLIKALTYPMLQKYGYINAGDSHAI